MNHSLFVAFFLAIGTLLKAQDLIPSSLIPEKEPIPIFYIGTQSAQLRIWDSKGIRKAGQPGSLETITFDTAGRVTKETRERMGRLVAEHSWVYNSEGCPQLIEGTFDSLGWWQSATDRNARYHCQNGLVDSIMRSIRVFDQSNRLVRSVFMPKDSRFNATTVYRYDSSGQLFEIVGQDSIHITWQPFYPILEIFTSSGDQMRIEYQLNQNNQPILRSDFEVHRGKRRRFPFKRVEYIYQQLK